MIPAIRLHSQQLVNPDFDTPKDLVSWMGAIQAQDYTMSKWAVGIRLKSGTLQTVDEALQKGEILRTHVMRPTWHYVAAEDIRWMLKLSARRIIAANDCYAKGRGQDISTELYHKANTLLEKILADNNHLTKQEIDEAFKKAGIETDERQSNRFLTHAEAEGVICSGIDKNSKITYALLEERVPPVKELHKEEALAKLALHYFRSHSPASLKDFVWWSGLSVAEARQGIAAIEQELGSERFNGANLYVHQSCKEENVTDILHILPSYDEYLISYKDRTDVLKAEHQSKAFNTFGLFRPVILHNGHIVGNWNKVSRKSGLSVCMEWFEKDIRIKKALLHKAEERYIAFLSNKGNRDSISIF